MTVDCDYAIPADLRGSTSPRLFTPPLRGLTPETSYGFAVIDFARDVVNEPLDPWQEWAVIHGGELLADGRPRFRLLLILVARQNGKTHLLKILALFWLFVEKHPLILGTSSNLEVAKESWAKAVETAEATPELAQYMAKNAVLRGNNDIHMKTTHRTKYKIAAANRRGGRGSSIDKLIMDELREHRDWEAYNASEPATNARPYAQIVMISNAGDEQSVVLNTLREQALAFDPDSDLGILEWSAPDNAHILDPMGWAAANPNLGIRIPVSVIAGPAKRAHEAGGEVKTGFITERLCRYVPQLDGAVDPQKWADCGVGGALKDGRIALCLDVSLDSLHATIAAASVTANDITFVGVVEAWDGPNCAQQMLGALPGIAAKMKPKTIGWFPAGPAAVLAANLGKSRQPGWPPANITVAEIRAEIAAVCMGFAEQVSSGRIAYLAGDVLLDTHVLGVEKLISGATWVFSRKGKGPCDAAYAAAGAVHLARTLPVSRSTTIPAGLTAMREQLAAAQAA